MTVVPACVTDLALAVHQRDPGQLHAFGRCAHLAIHRHHVQSKLVTYMKDVLFHLLVGPSIRNCALMSAAFDEINVTNNAGANSMSAES